MLAGWLFQVKAVLATLHTTADNIVYILAGEARRVF